MGCRHDVIIHQALIHLVHIDQVLIAYLKRLNKNLDLMITLF